MFGAVMNSNSVVAMWFSRCKSDMKHRELVAPKMDMPTKSSLEQRFKVGAGFSAVGLCSM